MNELPEVIHILILEQLDDLSFWNSINASERLARAAKSSRKLMLKYRLELTPEKLSVLSSGGELSTFSFRNISIKSFKGAEQLRKLSKVLKNLKGCIEILELEDFKRCSKKEVIAFFDGFSSLRILKLRLCLIAEEVNHQVLKPLESLTEIFYEKCDGNFFKIFKNQVSIIKIGVQNDENTWNGFNHEEFNDLMKTLPNCIHMVLKGVGTGSYFDCDNFPYKIKILETTSITHSWYIGLRVARTNFLESQKGSLKELTIENFPFDFDGGNVLKFIINEMELNYFRYKNLIMMLNGLKQPIKEVSATEIQLCSFFEVFLHFPTIESCTLIINDTDIHSSEIERVVDPETHIFDNVKYFEVLDKSVNQRALGIFLGLFKNFRNIESLKIESQYNNIHVLFQEFLPHMTSLNKITIDVQTTNIDELLGAIRTNVPDLQTLVITAAYIERGRHFFGTDVNIYPISS